MFARNGRNGRDSRDCHCEFLWRMGAMGAMLCGQLPASVWFLVKVSKHLTVPACFCHFRR